MSNSFVSTILRVIMHVDALFSKLCQFILSSVEY